jgi:hypothetical protein
MEEPEINYCIKLEKEDTQSEIDEFRSHVDGTSVKACCMLNYAITILIRRAKFLSLEMYSPSRMYEVDHISEYSPCCIATLGTNET